MEYTKVFSQPKFCSKSSESIFNSVLETCPYTNCLYTCEKSEENLKRADLLLFHQRDLETELINKYEKSVTNWLEATEQIPFKGKLEHKLANSYDQLWLLWNDEATIVDQTFDKVFFVLNNFKIMDFFQIQTKIC